MRFDQNFRLIHLVLDATNSKKVIEHDRSAPWAGIARQLLPLKDIEANHKNMIKT